MQAARTFYFTRVLIAAAPIAILIATIAASPSALASQPDPASLVNPLVGTTNGGNDGSAFSDWGVPDVPIGWPLRYSHSPAEVVDLRDVAGLADLVSAIAEGW